LQAILYTIGNNFKKGDMLMPKLLWRIGAVMLLMCGGFIFLFIAASQMMVQQYKPFFKRESA